MWTTLWIAPLGLALTQRKRPHGGQGEPQRRRPNGGQPRSSVATRPGAAECGTSGSASRVSEMRTGARERSRCHWASARVRSSDISENSGCGQLCDLRTLDAAQNGGVRVNQPRPCEPAPSATPKPHLCALCEPSSALCVDLRSEPHQHRRRRAAKPVTRVRATSPDRRHQRRTRTDRSGSRRARGAPARRGREACRR